MATTLPPLNFLTRNPGYIDYRPAVNATGDLVVFERTPVGGNASTLTAVADFSHPQPKPFLSVPFAPPAQTRPDWCWKTGDLLFNGAATNNDSPSVWWLPNAAGNLVAVPNTAGADYPTWSLDGTSFVTENAAGTPDPCNTVFDTSGTVVSANIDGYASVDGNIGPWLFGGMPTVGPGDLPQIAFAGQPAVDGWGGSSGYNQNQNYIFLNAVDGDSYTSTPMESGASITSYDPSFQARAPAWSPDGSTIVFESDRSGQGYAIYLFDRASGAVTQVTDPRAGAQHAKFFPDGSKLILCAYYPNASPAHTGIAWVDISGLLKS